MRSKGSAAARMTQQLKLACVDCGARAFYASTRGSVCKGHKWSNRDGKSKREEKQKEESKTASRSARLPDASDGGAGQYPLLL
jgi:hypothetical protein